MDISAILVVIACAGASGGIVHGMVKPARYSLQLPFCPKRLELGFLGDALVGVTSAICIFFVACPLLNIRLVSLQETPEFLKVISVGIIAGFAGPPIIAALSVRLIDQISKVDKKVAKLETREKSDALVRSGDFHFLQENYEHALAYYERALEIDEENIEALLGKAKALKRVDDISQISQAISICSKVLAIDPINDRALYNRACYKCLAGTPVGEVLADLQNVLNEFPYYKQYAIADPDLKRVQKEPPFRDLVGP